MTFQTPLFSSRVYETYFLASKLTYVRGVLHDFSFSLQRFPIAPAHSKKLGGIWRCLECGHRVEALILDDGRDHFQEELLLSSSKFPMLNRVTQWHRIFVSFAIMDNTNLERRAPKTSRSDPSQLNEHWGPRLCKKLMPSTWHHLQGMINYERSTCRCGNLLKAEIGCYTWKK